MHHHAANPAAQPYLSLSIFSAPTTSPEDRSGSSERPSYCGAFTSSLELRFGRTSGAELDECDSVQWESSASFPVLYSGSRFGAYPAPCGTALFCFGFAALRVTVSVYDGPSANAELGTWEPGPLARLCRE